MAQVQHQGVRPAAALVMLAAVPVQVSLLQVSQLLLLLTPLLLMILLRRGPGRVADQACPSGALLLGWGGQEAKLVCLICFVACCWGLTGEQSNPQQQQQELQMHVHEHLLLQVCWAHGGSNAWQPPLLPLLLLLQVQGRAGRAA
jgi:hypothetical protein